MITVTLTDAGTTARLEALAHQVGQPAALAAVVGREGVNRLKAHFRAKHRQEPNRLNPGRRQNFWLQVAQSVSAPVIATGGTTVTISISDPRFAQKVFGGTITAKRAGALTIPVSPDAYGRTTKTFEAETGLKLFLLRPGGKGGNRFRNAVLASARGGGLQVEFVLKLAVNQDKDATALPDEVALQAALILRAEAWAARRAAEANGQTPGGAE